MPCTVALQQLNACDLAHARQNVSALALAHRRSAQVNQVRPFVGTQLRCRREDMHAAERVRYHSHLRCLDRPHPCRARPTRSIQRCASELKANRKGDGCQRKRVRRPQPIVQRYVLTYAYRMHTPSGTTSAGALAARLACERPLLHSSSRHRTAWPIEHRTARRHGACRCRSSLHAPR